MTDATRGMQKLIERIEALIEFEKEGDRWDSVTVLMQVREWLGRVTVNNPGGELPIPCPECGAQ